MSGEEADIFFILMTREGEDGEWVPNYERRYETGAEAQARAKEINQRNAMSHWESRRNTRVRVRKVVNTDSDNFYSREKAKNFAPLPWEQNGWYMRQRPWMLPHISPDDKFQVRYFDSIEDAIEGKYSTLGVSRFMTRCDDKSDEERERILIKIGYYNGITDFGITQDPELIFSIYTNGPSSCMNDPDEYELPDPHPSIVYSKGDLAVAYVKNNRGFSARAVVCPERHIYHSIYGHSGLIKEHLTNAGYIFASGREFEGCKVGAIRGEEGWLMPYIDCLGEATLDEDNGLFILTSDGEYDVRTTDGYAYTEN